jgi:lysophospholipase L1-like esterase
MHRIHQLLKAAQPLKWVFYGDSITHGALHTFGWRDYTELFTERLRYELGRSQDVVIKTAISGNTTAELLRDFDWRVAQFRPQVVFVMVGMNDCSTGRKIPLEQFRTNLADLAGRIAGLDALPVLQTTCPIMPGTSPDREPYFDAYMQAVRDAAAAGSFRLIDHTRYWEQACQGNAGLFHYWMSNAFHPNQHGHQVFAECLFKELGIYDPRAFTCRLFRP